MLINKQTNALNYDESLEVPRDSFHLDFIIGQIEVVLHFHVC